MAWRGSRSRQTRCTATAPPPTIWSLGSYFVTAQVPRYHTITAPTVIITGDRDTTLWSDIHARPISTLIPGAKLIVLKGIGHMLPHVVPEVIVAEIDALTGKARIAIGE